METDPRRTVGFHVDGPFRVRTGVSPVGDHEKYWCCSLLDVSIPARTHISLTMGPIMTGPNIVVSGVEIDKSSTFFVLIENTHHLTRRGVFPEPSFVGFFQEFNKSHIGI